MNWSLSFRADQAARVIADRHYNRQSVGAAQFVPPGRCLVLVMSGAFWVTSWPFAEHVKHAWAGAWVCSAFRNESTVLSSSLILEAEAATRWTFGDPPSVPDTVLGAVGFVTFVDASKVRRKRDPGRCFLRAGWTRIGETKGGLLAFGKRPVEIAAAAPPKGANLKLLEATA